MSSVDPPVRVDFNPPATITVTTESSVITAIGGAVDPGDDTVRVDYQQSDYRGNYTKDQIWLNYLRNDRTKLLRNLYRNNQLINIIGIKVGGTDPSTVKTSLATLSATFRHNIERRLTDDPYFGNLCRHSVIESETTDGGFLASGSNPKAVFIIVLRIEYYTIN